MAHCNIFSLSSHLHSCFFFSFYLTSCPLSRRITSEIHEIGNRGIQRTECNVCVGRCIPSRLFALSTHTLFGPSKHVRSSKKTREILFCRSIPSGTSAAAGQNCSVSLE